MNFEPAIRRLSDRRRFQDAWPHDIPVPGDAHAMLRFKEEIRAGMTVDELDAALGGEAAAWDSRYGTNSQIVYRYYDNLGIGVRIAGNKVSEIIVAQIPANAKVE